MKCSSIILFFLFTFSAWATDNFVLPKNNNTFTNGDRATLLIESKLSDAELRKFENTKITDVIYVFKFTIEGGDREFEVIFSDPPQKKSDKERPFIAKGINYTFDKERTGNDFVLLDSNFSPTVESNFLATFVYVFLGVLLLLLIYYILKNSNELRHRRLSKERDAENLMALYKKAKSREDFENIFKKRKDFEEHLDFSVKNWEKLTEQINKLQYRPTWSEEDLKSVESLALKNSDMRIKRGV